jgi:hypothetical protein
MKFQLIIKHFNAIENVGYVIGITQKMDKTGQCLINTTTFLTCNKIAVKSQEMCLSILRQANLI